MAEESVSLKWSAQFSVAPPSRLSKLLPGDKVFLPPSALEQLLSAATVISTTSDATRSYTSTFDPCNPYSYAAERQARAQFVDQQQQLPHPLTFRLVNPQSGRVVHAGIREFSAEEGEVGLSPFLRQALGLEYAKGSSGVNGSQEYVEGSDKEIENAVLVDLTGEQDLPRITVHAKQLPKGTYVRLRPLEAGYDPEDWKSLLEQHLRANFTTLTHGEILTVPGGRGIGGANEEFRFLIDKFEPGGDGICVVDTDLEVDIEALNEEQARETLKRQVAKSQKAPGTKESSSLGGKLDIWEGQQGQVQKGEYVDYELRDWDRSQALEIELRGVNDDEEVDVVISPLAPRQRARPRVNEHVFGEFSSRYPKRIQISPTNIALEKADVLWVSVYGYKPSIEEEVTTAKRPAAQYHLRVTPADPASQQHEETPDNTHSSSDEIRCKNCHQWVPQRTMMLHENFCLRNNILCPHCNNVYKKSSPEWQNHWHCPHDPSYGDSSLSKMKHDNIFHTPQACPKCSYYATSLPELAHHQTTVCPGKIILCQFCHLLVPQEGDPSSPNPEALLSGLTVHELADGARTTECHLCSKIIRLRDMTTHLRHHDLERLSRPKPRICRNANCGRTLDGVGRNGDIGAAARMGQGPGNDIGLCSICFGPLYVSMYDPEGKALKRRVERRYLTQLLTGCGKGWCRDTYCKTGRKNSPPVLSGGEMTITAKDALPTIKPFVDALPDLASPLHFCVDEGSQKRRALANMLAAEGQGGYDLEWCVAALEAEAGDLDKAQGWLKSWAPTRADGLR
ncbi:MAG: hypothetical protein M1827_005818 [Pycnora praestabilis]|nr:MAG: hypothetical protein M1827_005818 [Pycnora praestabilis]